MTAVAKVEEQTTGQIVQADSASIMAVIARAASDPATDVDKLERLMGMYERLESRKAEQAYNEAMSAAQQEIGVVGVNRTNTQTKSKYATYDALDRHVRPIYVKHGFSLSFDTAEGAPADHIRLICRVGHIGGFTRTHHVDMPADGKGAKGGDVMTRTHAAGSAFSYGQRYLLKLIFNIATGEDDDGNAASGPKITQAQIDDLVGLMDEVKADRARFLKFMRVESLHDIPASRYQAAVKALEAKRSAQ